MFLKRAAAVFAAAVISVSLLAFPSLAAEEKQFDIVVSNETAVPGDNVIFNVDIVNNPAIAAVTVSFHYNPEVLEFIIEKDERGREKGYHDGMLKYDTLGTTNMSKGYISIVYCASDKLGDGTLFSLEFKVKDTAQVGKYPVTVKSHRPDDNMRGTFANENYERLVPTVTAGSVEIKYNGSNCRHKYSQFSQKVEAGCKTKGKESRSCSVCGHTELRDTAEKGHIYSESWTIDTAATADKKGIMSRHCTGCSESVADRASFTVSDAESNGFKNTVGTVLAPNSWEPLKPAEKPEPTEPEEPGDKPQLDENLSAEELLGGEQDDEPENNDKAQKQDEPKDFLERIPNYLLITAAALIVIAIVVLLWYIFKR